MIDIVYTRKEYIVINWFNTANMKGEPYIQAPPYCIFWGLHQQSGKQSTDKNDIEKMA